MSYAHGIRNPLLPSPKSRSKRTPASPRGINAATFFNVNTKNYVDSSPALSVRSIFKKSTMKLAVASAQRLRANKILPNLPAKSSKPVNLITDLQKSISSSDSVSTPRVASSLTRTIVHYNGPVRSLDEFPKETMEWLKKSTVAEDSDLGDNNNRHVTFKKAISQGKKPQNNDSRLLFLPKGLFYLRVLQITNKASAKCNDVNAPFTANLKVYCQSKRTNLFGGNRTPTEICLGQETLKFDSIWPMDKRIHRIDLQGSPENSSTDNFQILVSIGLHVNSTMKEVIQETRYHADYVTMYVRGGLTPRWQRYWAVLKGPNLQLFDFEYQEDRPPLAIIPLRKFLSAFHPSVDDDDRQVDVGSMGLALQFSEQCVSADISNQEHIRELPVFERRMYMLADNLVGLSKWESVFEHISKIMGECRNSNSPAAPVPNAMESLSQNNSHSDFSGIKQLYENPLTAMDPEMAVFYKFLW